MTSVLHVGLHMSNKCAYHQCGLLALFSSLCVCVCVCVCVSGPWMGGAEVPRLLNGNTWPVPALIPVPSSLTRGLYYEAGWWFYTNNLNLTIANTFIHFQTSMILIFTLHYFPLFIISLLLSLACISLFCCGPQAGHNNGFLTRVMDVVLAQSKFTRRLQNRSLNLVSLHHVLGCNDNFVIVLIVIAVLMFFIKSCQMQRKIATLRFYST